MILDTLANAGRYRGLSPRLDRGLEALERLAAAPPADGRHDLEGSGLYASLSTYWTGSPESKPFEAHRRYIDIQVALAGRETLFWAPQAGLAVRTPYSDAEDITLYEDPPGGGLAVALAPGSFAVLFAQDAHKPGCRAELGGRDERVRKLVLKVEAAGRWT